MVTKKNKTEATQNKKSDYKPGLNEAAVQRRVERELRGQAQNKIRIPNPEPQPGPYGFKSKEDADRARHIYTDKKKSYRSNPGN